MRRVAMNADGGKGRVVVEDTGPGIDDELLPRVFEPFFTTKDVGEGTGLGLAISERIVQEMGGRIEVLTAVGTGSTFSVQLPPAIGARPTSTDLAAP